MRIWIVWALVMTTLAGCTEEAPDAEPVTDVEEAMTIDIHGIVQALDVTPIAEAVVQVKELNATAVTGADGRFVIAGVTPRLYTLQASADGFVAQTLTFSHLQPRELLFVLAREPTGERVVPLNFHGIVQCAAEYFIITPSCDSLTEDLYRRGVPLPNEGSITEDTTEFEVLVEDGWQTVVVDLMFELGDHPGLEALRTTVSATNDPNALGEYDQYGRFQAPESYTFHISPEGTYPDGVKPVPHNATGFRLNVYTQGHGWHALCEPPVPPVSPICPLGLGAAVDVEFEVYVHIFYGKPAPVGWSSLG